MTYSKTVTQQIIKYWGMGLSAEETVELLKEKEHIYIGVNTVYRHRNSLQGQILIDELQRSQMRDIATETDPALRMKYRNELLKILIPLRIESYSQTITETVNHDKTLEDLLNNVPTENRSTVINGLRALHRQLPASSQGNAQV